MKEEYKRMRKLKEKLEVENRKIKFSSMIMNCLYQNELLKGLFKAEDF